MQQGERRIDRRVVEATQSILGKELNVETGRRGANDKKRELHKVAIREGNEDKEKQKARFIVFQSRSYRYDPPGLDNEFTSHIVEKSMKSAFVVWYPWKQSWLVR